MSHHIHFTYTSRKGVTQTQVLGVLTKEGESAAGRVVTRLQTHADKAWNGHTLKIIALQKDTAPEVDVLTTSDEVALLEDCMQSVDAIMIANHPS